MKAMILSAGFGTRLKHYTTKIPKALVRYRNKPMISYQIELLKSLGVDEIVVNAHHHSHKIAEYFSSNKFGVDGYVIVEEEILGTGGGILNAEQFFRDEDFFLVINVDVETNMDFERMIIYHQSLNPLATIAVQNRISKRYLDFDDDMKLTGRAKKIDPSINQFAFNGVHIISNRIFKLGLEIKYQDILDIYFKAIKENNEVVRGYDVGGCNFKDLGKIENLLS